MSRVAYLAQPIDFSEDPETDSWAHQMAHALAARGWLVYLPAMAWAMDRDAKPGPEVESINRWALGDSGLMVAFLPKGTPTHGVPMEIEYATSRGITVLVHAPFGVGWAIAGTDARVFEKLDNLLAAIPRPVLASSPEPDGQIKFHVGNGGRLPTRAHEGDVGYDLYSCQDVVVPPGGFVDVPTRVRVALPAGYWAHIVGRSSTWRKWNLHAIPGVIDTGYRGELFSAVQNPGGKEVFVPAGTRLTQLILHHNLASIFDPVAIHGFAFDELPGDGRGSAGFGSTGS